jgi:hypothetical protein
MSFRQRNIVKMIGHGGTDRSVGGQRTACILSTCRVVKAYAGRSLALRVVRGHSRHVRVGLRIEKDKRPPDWANHSPNIGAAPENVHLRSGKAHRT